MCRNIRRLYNLEPPATDAEIRDAALQLVRKVSGYRQPSQINAETFEHTVDEIAHAVRHMMDSLVTSAPRRDREADAAWARDRVAKRYGS